jgi:hypothetical protein
MSCDSRSQMLDVRRETVTKSIPRLRTLGTAKKGHGRYEVKANSLSDMLGL